MDKFAGVVGRQYRLFDYVGSPNAERVIVLMGSGAETAQETVDYLNAKGREGRHPEGPALSSVLRQGLHRCASRARQRRSPSWTGRRNRARPASRSTWTSSPRSRESIAGGNVPTEIVPEGRRRPLRALLEGIHAGHGQGGLRRPGETVAAATTSRSASTTMSRIRASTVDPSFTTEPDDVVRAHLLRPRRRRHGGRQQELHQDHRRGHDQLRAGLLRLRLEEVRLHDHVAPALRAAPDPFDLPDRRRRTSWPATSGSSSRSSMC